MSDSPFQVTGIASGISWDEIISKTLEAARKPEEQWQTKIDTLEYKKSLYQELSSAFFKLRNTLTTLRLTTTFKSKTPEFTVRNAGQLLANGEVKASNASDIIKVTASANAEIAQWKIDVKSIAVAQQRYSGRVSDESAALGLTGKFNIRAGIQVAAIEVAPSDTLLTINQKIANAKDQYGDPMLVEAQLIDNRIVITSTETGANNTGAKAAEQIDMSYGIPVLDASNNITGYKMYLPKAKDGVYPPNLLFVQSGSGASLTEYKNGVDYTYDATEGSITWDANSSDLPADMTTISLGYTQTFSLASGSNTFSSESASGVLTAMASSGDLRFELVASDGTAYDYYDSVLGTGDYDITPSGGGAYTVNWHTTEPANYTLRIVQQVDDPSSVSNPPDKMDLDYSTDSNAFYLEDTSGVLAALGFSDANSIAAQDAEFTVNGIPVTRQTNVIDDLIAEVKLELVGVGDVTMNITQDAQKAVDAVQAYVDAYNEVMTWINEKLDEKYTSATIEEDDDYLQNLLSASKGSTVFGALHGDQLLWNIKNQMRNLTVNPIDSAARGLATKKYMFTANSLGLNASFYLYAAGQAIRVNISPTDSLEDIQRNIANSTSITSVNGTSATGADLKLKVYLRDGQLVVDYNSASVLTSPRTDVITRNHGSTGDYDVLPYTPTTAAPVSGKLTVSYGTTTYQEGLDYRVETDEVGGALVSKLVWLPSGSRPADGQSYTTSYEYNTTAIAYGVISGADDLSTLGLHTDQSKSQLSTFGITTTADDYGKSGLIDFDPDVLFAAIQDDANNTSNVMTSFFRSVDTYIGNLVDSSQVLVAGTAVTKGRIAGAMLSIDVEVETLNSQITKLERQLAERQTSMYKQYSDMELAIQKLNAQMSSLSQYFANTSTS